jgi:hypothetical protein
MKDSPHNNWKYCIWWFQDKCNDYEHCGVCKLHNVKQEIVEKFKTILDYKISLERRMCSYYERGTCWRDKYMPKGIHERRTYCRNIEDCDYKKKQYRGEGY